MRKRLHTRFPAARIKKIMQSDEDVGKIAMAVPLLVSKALELFLQDLCGRTHEITTARGAKTISSFHLKQCVQTFNIFDFLKDIVRDVPDLADSTAAGDDRLVGRRRKLADFKDENGMEESISKKHATAHTSGGVKGRGRGRGRGSRATVSDKFEDDPDMNDLQTTPEDRKSESLDTKASTSCVRNTPTSVQNFDLNLDLDENGNPVPASATGSNDTTEEFVKETVHGEHASLSSIMFSSIDQVTEDDENYDV